MRKAWGVRVRKTGWVRPTLRVARTDVAWGEGGRDSPTDTGVGSRRARGGAHRGTHRQAGMRCLSQV